MIKTITDNPDSWPEPGRIFVYFDDMDGQFQALAFDTGMLKAKDFYSVWRGTAWCYLPDLLSLFTGKVIPVSREDLEKCINDAVTTTVVGHNLGEVSYEAAQLETDLINALVHNLTALLEDKDEV